MRKSKNVINSVRGKGVIKMLFHEIVFVFTVPGIQRGGKTLGGSDQGGFDNSLLMLKDQKFPLFL